MGAYAGPEINESGLVLCLDSGNPKGYDSYENLKTNSATSFFPVIGTWTSTATSTDITAPDGSSTTYKVVSNGSGNCSIDIGYLQITLTAGVTYTISAYYYATHSTNAGRTIAIAMFGNSNSGTAPIVLPQNQWVRQSLTFTATNTYASGQMRMISNDTGGLTTTNGATVYLWGAQVETGSTANPYYPTTASTKTRGTTLIDLTGRGNNGTLTNGPTYSSVNGGAIVFDGSNDYVSFNSFDFSNELTVFCFIQPSSTNTIQSIFANSAGGTATNGIRLFLNTVNTNSRSIIIEVGNGTNGGIYVFSPNNTIVYDTWQQIAFTLSKTTATGIVYYNGSSIATNTLGVTNYSSSAAFRLGLFTDNQFPYNGRVANYSLYNRALSATEISQNYNALRGRFGI